MYIAEIAPAHLRGRLVGTFQFNIVFGILVAYFSNYVVGQAGLSGDEWRWKLGLAAVPSLLFLVMLYTIPRSPRWLVKTGQVEEAREVLRMIGEAEPDRRWPISSARSTPSMGRAASRCSSASTGCRSSSR